MTRFERFFKIALLVLGLGFLAVYAYQQHGASVARNLSVNPRYAMSVSDSAHAVFLVDIKEGTVYYAFTDPSDLYDKKPLKWQVSSPKSETKK